MLNPHHTGRIAAKKVNECKRACPLTFDIGHCSLVFMGKIRKKIIKISPPEDKKTIIGNKRKSGPLLVLHLSDLHFGEHSRFRGLAANELVRRLRAAVNEELSRREVKAPIGLTVVTGDIVESARQEEYSEALCFFEELADTLPLPRHKFVFTPGNHDVSWFQSRRVEIDREEKHLDERWFRNYVDELKFTEFESFRKRFYGCELSNVAAVIFPGVCVHDFPDLAVSIAVLNTCELESHLPEHHRGYLSEQQAHEVMAYWRNHPVPQGLRLLALHHNPTGTVPADVHSWEAFLKTAAKHGKIDDAAVMRFLSDAVGFEGMNYLDAIAEDCGVHSILHGHYHASSTSTIRWKRDGKYSTPVFSAGSWALTADVLPQYQPNTFGLLTFERRPRRVRCWVMRYEPRMRTEGSVTMGAYVPDETLPRGYQSELPPLPASRSRARLTTPEDSALPKSKRRKLPEERQSITHKFQISSVEGYLIVGLYDNGSPGEVFIHVGQEGTTLNGLADALGYMISLALQHGVPLKEIITKLAHYRFDPQGDTLNPSIPTASSIVDYVARYLEEKFQRHKAELSIPNESKQSKKRATEGRVASHKLRRRGDARVRVR